jgi:tetratricopeptide (TPR) repeat protein
MSAWRWTISIGAACGLFAASGGSAAPAKATPPAADKDSAAVVTNLEARADALAQGGQKLKAAQVYEAIAKRNPSARRPLANRITRLYAECGVTNQALQWAAEVMRVHPDPQVFLAGIQTTLGNYAEAAKILTAQLGVAPSSSRRMTLLWQLADLCDKQGKPAEARQALAQAVAAASSDLERAAAKRRLEKFIEAQKAKEKAAPKVAPAASTNKPALPPKTAPRKTSAGNPPTAPRR